MTGTSTIISSDYGNTSAIFNRAYTYTINSVATNAGVDLTVPAGLTILGIFGPVTVTSIDCGPDATSDTEGAVVPAGTDATKNTIVHVTPMVMGTCVVNIIVAPMGDAEGHVDPKVDPAGE